MKPLGRRVLLKKPEISEKFGMIYIPEKSRTMGQLAEVLAIGDECTVPIKVGDQVFFPKHNFIEVVNEGLLVWERDLLGVVDE